MSQIELSQKDKYHIAEFVYSNSIDVLIKSDAEKVIEVLNKHFPKEKIEMDASVIARFLDKHVGSLIINAIMEDYFSGKLG